MVTFALQFYSRNLFCNEYYNYKIILQIVEIKQF